MPLSAHHASTNTNCAGALCPREHARRWYARQLVSRDLLSSSSSTIPILLELVNELLHWEIHDLASELR